MSSLSHKSSEPLVSSGLDTTSDEALVQIPIDDAEDKENEDNSERFIYISDPPILSSILIEDGIAFTHKWKDYKPRIFRINDKAILTYLNPGYETVRGTINMSNVEFSYIPLEVLPASLNDAKSRHTADDSLLKRRNIGVTVRCSRMDGYETYLRLISDKDEFKKFKLAVASVSTTHNAFAIPLLPGIDDEDDDDDNDDNGDNDDDGAVHKDDILSTKQGTTVDSINRTGGLAQEDLFERQNQFQSYPHNVPQQQHDGYRGNDNNNDDDNNNRSDYRDVSVVSPESSFSSQHDDDSALLRSTTTTTTATNSAGANNRYNATRNGFAGHNTIRNDNNTSASGASLSGLSTAQSRKPRADLPRSSNNSNNSSNNSINRLTTTDSGGTGDTSAVGAAVGGTGTVNASHDYTMGIAALANRGFSPLIQIHNTITKSIMRRSIAQALNRYDVRSRKERILAKRGALKFLPVCFKNDLVHGSWWFVWGSLGFMLTSLVAVANSFDMDLIGEDDSNLPIEDYRATWILMVLSGVFSTLGSLAFVRALHEDPPMRPMFANCYHLQNDELLGSWLFMLATVPCIPYTLIYLSVDHYRNLLYLVGLIISLIITAGSYMFVRACYPTDKKFSTNLFSPAMKFLCYCCCSRGWVRFHLQNDWLAGTWFFLWACIAATFVCFVLFLAALGAHHDLMAFVLGTSLVENMCFLIGSAYFVAGSYPEGTLHIVDDSDDPANSGFAAELDTYMRSGDEDEAVIGNITTAKARSSTAAGTDASGASASAAASAGVGVAVGVRDLERGVYGDKVYIAQGAVHNPLVEAAGSAVGTGTGTNGSYSPGSSNGNGISGGSSGDNYSSATVELSVMPVYGSTTHTQPQHSLKTSGASSSSNSSSTGVARSGSKSGSKNGSKSGHHTRLTSLGDSSSNTLSNVVGSSSTSSASSAGPVDAAGTAAVSSIDAGNFDGGADVMSSSSSRGYLPLNKNSSPFS